MMPKWFFRRPQAAVCLMIALVAALIGGCGFQPRGHSAGLPDLPSPIQIRGLAPYNDLYRELSRQLKIAGAEVVTAATANSSVLIITAAGADARLLSVDNRNKAVEYELVEAATFHLNTAGGRQLIAPQRLNVLRIQYRPPVAVLGSNREAELLRRDMREQLAGRIIQRLAVQYHQVP